MTDQIREQVSALLDGELPRRRDGPAGAQARARRGTAARLRQLCTHRRGAACLRAHRWPARSFAARVSAAHRAARRRHGRISSAAARVLARRSELPPPAGGVCHRCQRRHCRRAAVPAVCGSHADRGQRRTSQNRPVATNLTLAASPTPAQSQRLAGYMVAHSQFATPMVRRNVWSEPARRRSRA